MLFLSHAPLANASNWSIAASNTISTNLYRYSDTQRSYDNELSIATAYKINPKLSAGLRVSVAKSFSGTRQGALADSSLSLTYSGGPINSFTQWAISGALVIPSSKQSRIYDKLYSAIILSPSLSFDLKSLGLERLAPSYTLSITRTFYQYKTASAGRALKEYNVKHIFDVSYALFDQLELAAYYSYANAFTYQGNRSTSFGLGQEASYAVSKNLRWSVGHNNEGSTLKTNGQDSNISLANPDTSSIYTTFKYRF